MKYPAYLYAFLFTLLALGGCDIAPEQTIGGLPVNLPNTELDPDEAQNIAAYFYLDKPVVGLNYSCEGATALPITGKTDSAGRFVCPRSTTAAFYVGTLTNRLWLGGVKLNIFGLPDDENRLNHVAITPSTLYGTTADASRNELPNIYNLLTALDLSGFDGRPKIHLLLQGVDVNEYVAPYVESLNLLSSPNAFAVSAEPMLRALVDEHGIALTNGGSMLAEDVVIELTDRALRRARAGVYRTASPTTATDVLSGRSATNTVQVMVGHNGSVTGLSSVLLLTGTGPSTASIDLKLLSLDPAASLTAGGVLSGFEFRSAADDVLTVSGRLVNDVLYGVDVQLDAEQNTDIPSSYVYSEADVGQFVFDGLVGDATLYRAAFALPDVPLEMFASDGTPDQSPGTYLPLDFAIFYQGYDQGMLATEEERDDPAKLVDHPPLLFRIRDDGDIVSDLDGDCQEVSQVGGGELRDAGGQREYLIGQVGSVFKTDDIVYMTLLLAVYDAGHPAWGFTFGTTSLFTNLTPVVLNTQTGELRSKQCAPGTDCTVRLEWTNDMIFGRDVYGADLANGTPPADDPERDNDLYRRGDYLGKIKESSRYCLVFDQ